MVKNKVDRNKIIKPRLSSQAERDKRIKASKKKYSDNNKRVAFWLTNEEYNKFDSVSKSLEFASLSAFAKEKLINGSNTPFVSKMDRKAIADVQKIGVNVNQIARVVNTYKNETNFGEISTSLKSIQQQINDIILSLSK